MCHSCPERQEKHYTLWINQEQSLFTTFLPDLCFPAPLLTASSVVAGGGGEALGLPLPTSLFQKVPGHHVCLTSALPAPQPCHNGASFCHIAESRSVNRTSEAKPSKGIWNEFPEVGTGEQGDAAVMAAPQRLRQQGGPLGWHHVRL